MADGRSLQFGGRGFDAFLFDMDGTILDSTAVVERSWRAWAARHGVDEKVLLAQLHGVRAIDTMRRFGPPGIDPAVEAEAMMEAEMADLAGIVPVGGAAPFLRALPEGSWAIVTSASRALAERRLAACRLPMPRVLVAAEDVTRGKPDPEGFRTAAALLGVAADRCLVFEDSDAGIAAGLAAGATVVAVGGRAAPIAGVSSILTYD